MILNRNIGNKVATIIDHMKAVLCILMSVISGFLYPILPCTIPKGVDGFHIVDCILEWKGDRQVI
jgi:hypothetical protein